MSAINFWSNWDKDNRYAGFAVSLVFLASLIYLWYGYFREEKDVIQWQKLQEQKVIDVPVHSFRAGPFNLEVPGESYVILEYFNGSALNPSTTAAGFSLFVLSLGIAVLFAVITCAPRFWYYTGIALFTLFMISIRFEVLMLFGIKGQLIPIVIILLFLVPSYYFNRIRPSASLATRIAAFVFLMFLTGVVTAFFSTVAHPFYHLYLTSYIAQLVLSLLFLTMIAHEVIAGFLRIVGNSSSRTILHFSIISAIYFVNLVITMMHEMELIQWDFVYINLYLLLTVSASLGLWGFRNREVLYENIITFRPAGALMYLALGAICLSTAGQLLQNANDPAVEVIREAIIYTHVGYGSIFLLYVISNFGPLLYDNRPAYKVLYQPTRMPYFTFRLAGLIATVAIVLYSNWHIVVYNAMAGFYNYAGDLHTLLGNEDSALAFYRQAASQGAGNHRSNYVLANINTSRLNFEAAERNYYLANINNATGYSLTNAGNLYLWRNDVQSALRSYQASLERHGPSAHLLNNAGVAMTKIHKLDSALLYLEKARSDDAVKTTAETNFFALAALERIPLKVDSVLSFFGTGSDAVTSNALAVATLFRQPLKIDGDPLETKKLNLYSATLLNNYIILHRKDLDTAAISKAYAIASDEHNAHFSEAIKSSLAFAYYHQGNVRRALGILAELVYLSQDYQGKLNYIMGLWALEQNNADLAASYFNFADTYEYKEAKFYHAIALTEAGRTTKALSAWDSVLVKGDAAQKLIAAEIKRILQLPREQAITLKDPMKYQFSRYRMDIEDSVFFNRLSNTFEDANYQAQALLDASRRYFEKGYLKPAIHYYNRIAGLKLTDKTLFEEARHFELQLLAKQGDLANLARQINNGITFSPERNLEKLYYAALISEAGGDTATAAANYRILSSYNPYFEEGIIAAYRFFKKQNPRSYAAYEILAEAIHINKNSLPLLTIYREEALDMGLDEYAESAAESIREIRSVRE